MLAKVCTVCMAEITSPGETSQQRGNFARRKFCSRRCRTRDYANHAESWRKEDRKVNSEKYAVKNRIASLRKNYGMTLEQYAKMFSAQNGVCGLCGKPESKPHRSKYGLSYHLSVDHCHDTGEVRGLLCNQCNRAIGMFDDNPELLEKARIYLESFKAMHH